MQTISHKPTCALSQFLHWLNRRNVSHWQLRLLSSVPAVGGGAASSVAGGQDPVLRRRGVTGSLVSGYSLPPPAPSTLSHIVD